MAYCGIGAVGDVDNVRAFVSADSTSITTAEQVKTARGLDQLSTLFKGGIFFVSTIPDVGDAEELALYIDTSGVGKYLASDEAVAFTEI